MIGQKFDEIAVPCAYSNPFEEVHISAKVEV
jgi:hypothetical protein